MKLFIETAFAAATHTAGASKRARYSTGCEQRARCE
jgi:hypothetical protein